MRRLLAVVVLVLCAAVPARAQNCVTINGISRCAMPWQVYDTAQRVVSTPVLDLTQTWNQISTTFTGVKLNVTDTNSASGSLLLDLQVGGVSKYSVSKAGALTAVGGTLSGNLIFSADNTYDIGASGATRPRNLWLAGAATIGGSAAITANISAQRVFATAAAITSGSGTGITVSGNDSPAVVTLVYKVTIDKTAFICAAVTCDVTIATLPAKMFLASAVADLTQVFACSGTCTTATLSFTLGKTAGGNEYLLSVDADAATGQFGRTAATLGASLAPATVQTLIGDNASWSATTAIVLRMTSGTGNIGTGAATNFSTGSVTFWLTTTLLQ